MLGLYLVLSPSDRLHGYIRNIETNIRRAFDQSPRLLSLLGSDKITYLDIGARGGLSVLLSRYRAFIASILVEPDASEAEKLRQGGEEVVDKAIAGVNGEQKFYITKKPGLCSLLEPAGSFLPYYKGASDRFDVIKTIDINAVTLDSVAKKYGNQIDLLKIDTQDSELDILNSMGDLRPFAIISEMSFVELYKGQASVFELGSYLSKSGYIPFELNYEYTPPPIARKNRKLLYMHGLPIHGDICFIPDWTTQKGLQIIRQNELKWAAILLIYGLEDILLYILSVVNIDAKDKILETLNIAPKAKFNSEIFEYTCY